MQSNLSAYGNTADLKISCADPLEVPRAKDLMRLLFLVCPLPVLSQ